jgi:hypothetical protein
VNDIWIREKCVVTVGNMLEIAKYKYDAKVGNESFEAAFKFRPLPQPNHVEIIRQLLQKPMPAPVLQPSLGGLSEPWQTGGTGYAPPSGWRPNLGSNPNGSGHGNDGSGFCF